MGSGAWACVDLPEDATETTGLLGERVKVAGLGKFIVVDDGPSATRTSVRASADPKKPAPAVI
jgi:hypothetical protein